LSDLLDAALQANFVRIQLQQNSDTRKISALAAIALIPTLLIAIYSINFEYLDRFGNQKPYYLLAFSTIVLVAILSRNFRNRKWL
jgi:magnesium transporter